VFDSQTQAATVAFQRNMGLPETAVVDQATRDVLQSPRCGVPDGIAHLDSSDKWALINAGTWGRSNLTYKVLKGVGSISLDTVRSVVATELNYWSQYSGYTFSEVTGSAHADIRVTSGPIQDLTIIATTTSVINPSAGVDTILNSNLTFSTSNPATAIDLASIILHESGHALGLHHSNVGNAIMLPTIGSGQIKTGMTIDDQTGVLTMMPGWHVVDNNSDTDVAFNAHPFGALLWAIRGAQVPGGQQIWTYDGTWRLQPGGAIRISVNSNTVNGGDDRPWVVNNGGGIFRFNWATHNWDGVPGCARDVGVGTDGSVWVVGCDNSPGDSGIYKFNGIFPCTSNCWTADVGRAVRISVGPHDQSAGAPIVPWAVQAAGLVYRRSTGDPATGGWELLPGTATDVAAGYGVAWTIGTTSVPGGFNIQSWDEQVASNGVPWEFQWVTTQGGAVAIAVGNGFPFVVNSGGALFSRIF
jgi:hypothetical protein